MASLDSHHCRFDPPHIHRMRLRHIQHMCLQHNLSMVLSLGVTLLAFDFSGSGMSDGEYVSLGAYEKDDLDVVIEYLRKGGKTSTIALWGRSMGAATALMHGERDPSIAGMVLDSSFSSLVTLAEELVETGRKKGMFAPGVLVSIVLRWNPVAMRCSLVAPGSRSPASCSTVKSLKGWSE